MGFGFSNKFLFFWGDCHILLPAPLVGPLIFGQVSEERIDEKKEHRQALACR
jgi:hypothetical protein